MPTLPPSEGEQQQQCDQQRKDAERLGHREAEDEVAELALRRRRIAQRGREVMTEDGADADAGAAHADTRNASADEFCCGRFHRSLLSSPSDDRASMPGVDRIVEIDAGE